MSGTIRILLWVNTGRDMQFPTRKTKNDEQKNIPRPPFVAAAAGGGAVRAAFGRPNPGFRTENAGSPVRRCRPASLPAGRHEGGDAIPYYRDGVYHVFYLKGSDWAHIVSRELLHWTEMPDALARGADPQGPYGEAVWTGSVVEHDGMYPLFYTGKNINDPRGDQKVMQARSNDLVHWTKHPECTFYADGAVYWGKPENGPIDDRQIYHHQAFRDPQSSGARRRASGGSRCMRCRSTARRPASDSTSRTT